MLSVLRFTLAALGGIIAGAVGLSVLTVFVYALVAPDAFKDGQFVFVFILTVPLGAILGGPFGVATALLRAGSVAPAAWVYMTGGIVTALLAILTASAGRSSFGEILRALLAPEIGTTIAASLLALLYGRGLLRA